MGHHGERRDGTLSRRPEPGLDAGRGDAWRGGPDARAPGCGRMGPCQEVAVSPSHGHTPVHAPHSVARSDRRTPGEAHKAPSEDADLSRDAATPEAADDLAARAGNTAARAVVAGALTRVAPTIADDAPGPQEAGESGLAGVQRQATGDARPPTPGADFEKATSGGGAEVPFKEEMETAFGQDFSDVRAHTGQAGPMQGLHARAAARGNEVAFAAPKPDRHLVAHELTHVVQQRGGKGGVQRKAATGRSSEPAEGPHPRWAPPPRADSPGPGPPRRPDRLRPAEARRRPPRSRPGGTPGPRPPG